MRRHSGAQRMPAPPAEGRELAGSDAAAMVWFIGAGLAACVLHGLNLLWLLRPDTPLAGPLLTHIALSLILALLTVRLPRRGIGNRHLVMLLILSAATGVFGAAGALLGFVASLLYAERLQPDAATAANVGRSAGEESSVAIAEMLRDGLDRHPSAPQTTPYLDILRLGDVAQKCAAIAAIAQDFTPAYAPALRAGLTDASQEVRTAAAGALAQIEEDFTRRRLAIEEALAVTPDHPPLKLALAQYFDAHAFCGLLEQPLESQCRRHALEIYKSVLQQDPNARDIWMAVGRLLTRDGQWHAAADWFRHALDRGIDHPDLILWYLESLYRLRQFRDLRRLVMEFGRGILAREALPERVKHAVALWLQVA